MGLSNSKTVKETESRSTQPIDIRPEAHPEKGKECTVTLPNGRDELFRVYSAQTAGEFKLECMKNQDARPETIEVVLIGHNLEEMVLSDNEDLKEKLKNSHRILLRPKGATSDYKDLRDAVHVRQNPQN